MKKIRSAAKLVLFNWKPLAGFELLYKMASVLFFVPLLFGGFDLVMDSMGTPPKRRSGGRMCASRRVLRP